MKVMYCMYIECFKQQQFYLKRKVECNQFMREPLQTKETTLILYKVLNTLDANWFVPSWRLSESWFHFRHPSLILKGKALQNTCSTKPSATAYWLCATNYNCTQSVLLNATLHLLDLLCKKCKCKKNSSLSHTQTCTHTLSGLFYFRLQVGEFITQYVMQRLRKNSCIYKSCFQGDGQDRILLPGMLLFYVQFFSPYSK